MQTGEEDTPFDGDSSAFFASLTFHLVLLIVLGFLPLRGNENESQVTLTAPVYEDLEDELELPEQFFFSEQPTPDEIGANSEQGSQEALSEAPVVAEVSDVPTPLETEVVEAADLRVNEAIEIATGLHFNENLAVKGAAGEGTTGASGAIDRITHEILLSLEERKTLVVWLFDQSGSLNRQRQTIVDRFDRIYEELGVIEAAGNPAFAKHEDKPLLTSIIGFGNNVQLRTKEPTDNLAEIKEAVQGIPQDETGNERVFSAIYMAAKQFTKYRITSSPDDEPDRNVMLIVLTDEVGDDQDGLDQTVKMCRRYEMPVYVVGVPAPFGRRETMVKWVDPDPKFDQTPQWGRVDQGPESFLPERIKLRFFGDEKDDNPIDSGFGPFSLTRLCYETGGIYFAVHPNRNVKREVNRKDVAEFSAHLTHFFDPRIMRRYRPEYVSAQEYRRRVNASTMRQSLLQAAQMSWVGQMETPALEFVKASEAEFGADLSEAQKTSAKLEPKVLALLQVLQLGEKDRKKELSPRWQAGFDLSMGRVLAAQVRTSSYNGMLAKAKRGLKFKDTKNNTWLLEPDDDISVGSKLKRTGDEARTYLQRVIDDHPGTPWALLAKKELDVPLGWKWTEKFTDVSPDNNGGGGGNAGPATNDKKKMIKKGPPKRKLPKL
jgi:hypothetical protein